MKNVVLVTMVKNEGAIIQRMLQSAFSAAKYVVVCDTGSTDDTLQKATDACGDSIPFRAYGDEWKNFGHNRTLALKHGRDAIDKWGLCREETWMLLLDGDMILVDAGFNPSQLNDDVILLEQRGGGIAYSNVRLIRSSISATYKCYTHEYLDHGIAAKGTLKTLWIDDKGDGGCKADKLPRDEKLLQAQLKETPMDARTLFYLGHTLRDMGKTSEALVYYRKRVHVGGWDEEVWYSRYCIGMCLEKLGKTNEALDEYAGAWASRPWRNEPLLKMAGIYHARNDHARAYWTAKAGLSTAYPTGDLLFVEKEAYYDSFLRFASIHGYFIGQRTDAGKSADSLHFFGQDKTTREEALRNLSWYTNPLAGVPLSVPRTPPEGWSFCNPSIIKHGTDYLLNLRMVNYKINPQGGYYGFGDKVRTRNLLVTLDMDLKPIWEVELNTPEPHNHDAQIQGIEDVRLCSDWGCGVKGLGVRCDMYYQYPTMWQFRWDLSTGKCEEAKPLSTSGHTEKNWLVFGGTFEHGEKRVIYSHSPYTVTDLNKTVISHQFQMDLSGFRGGSAPIKWNGGWLYIIHEVTMLPGHTRRTYMHRFCWTDENLMLKKVSAPFHFREPHTIEFCSGLVAHRTGVLATYGRNDGIAEMMFVENTKVQEMLNTEVK